MLVKQLVTMPAAILFQRTAGPSIALIGDTCRFRRLCAGPVRRDVRGPFLHKRPPALEEVGPPVAASARSELTATDGIALRVPEGSPRSSPGLTTPLQGCGSAPPRRNRGQRVYPPTTLTRSLSGRPGRPSTARRRHPRGPCHRPSPGSGLAPAPFPNRARDAPGPPSAAGTLSRAPRRHFQGAVGRTGRHNPFQLCSASASAAT